MIIYYLILTYTIINNCDIKTLTTLSSNPQFSGTDCHPFFKSLTHPYQGEREREWEREESRQKQARTETKIRERGDQMQRWPLTSMEGIFSSHQLPHRDHRRRSTSMIVLKLVIPQPLLLVHLQDSVMG